MKLHTSAWLLLPSISIVVAANANNDAAAAPTLYERHLKSTRNGNTNGSGNSFGNGSHLHYGKSSYGEPPPDSLPDDWNAEKAAMSNTMNVGKDSLVHGIHGSSSNTHPVESLVIDVTDPQELAKLGVNVTDSTTEGADYEVDVEEEEEDYIMEDPDDLPVDDGIEGLDALEDALEDAEDDQRLLGEHHDHRHLQTSLPTYPIGDFAPLSCNANLATSDCSSNVLSSLLGTASDPITIPCGACYTYDLPSTTNNIIGGLNIVGKLYVPPNYKSALHTPYVFVQGQLTMSDTNPLSMDNESMKIVLTGNDDVMFTPADSNANVAGMPYNAGSKPFLVAGGKLDIRGWDQDQGVNEDTVIPQSWSPLVEMAEGALPIPTLLATPGEESAPVNPPDRVVSEGITAGGAGKGVQCPRAVVRDDFSADPNLGLFGLIWSGGDGNIVYREGGMLVVKDLPTSSHGIKLDFTDIVKECPLIDTATYLITMKIKIEHDAHVAGTPLQCEIDGQDCPRLKQRIYHDDDTDDATEERYIPRGVIGRYGEWFHFATTWQFKESEKELGSNVMGGVFTLEDFEVGSTVYLDDFVWELPSERSFLPQDGGEDTCAELVVNGDAEDNDGGGYHYYPMISSDENYFQPIILEEDDGASGGINRFYRTKARRGRAHSMRWRPNRDCFLRGYVFTISHRMRISNFSNGPMSYYLRFRGINGDGVTVTPTILECPEIDVTDGWQSCSGPLLITEEIASLMDIAVEILFPSDKETTEFADVDWDDVSIAFESGPAEGLAVQLDRTPRWGSNSEVHITSSTLNWKDSQLAVVDSTTPKTSTRTLKLTSGIDAVLSEKETPGMGVEVALLTRNLKIEAEYIEGETTEYQGGYLQILHTPGVAQIIEGVEFSHMGQRDRKNRHPIQLLYTKDVAGTSISRNSIRDSNNGCVWLDGVSGATVSSNVVHSSNGNDCFYVGYEATDNSIVGNLLSYIQSNDAFGVKSNENDFIGNVAAGTYGRGFYMNMDHSSYGEDGKLNGNLIGPGGSQRRKKMGLFRDNTAHSNHKQGFLLYHYEQFFTFRNEVDVPKFENMKAYRNREHGIYSYNVIAAEYRGGLLSDNQWGILLRVADRLLLEDYDIVGSSRIFRDYTITRDLKLCSSTNWDHTGIEMPAGLWRLNHNDPGLGIRMRNVNLSGFDKETSWYPNCKSTEPIHFSSDKKDGHFDYVSSAKNVNIVDVRGPSMIMNGCLAANDPGVKDIVITDMDGSFDPARVATVGALVSNYPHVTDILGNTCVDIGNCMAYCPGVCLRSVFFKVEQFGTENWKLKVRNTFSGDEMLIPSTLQVQNTAARSEHYFSDPLAGRRFSVSLPAGSYLAEFLDENGDLAWPTYVEEVWQKEPDCSGFASPGDITILKPPVDCTELIRNGGQDTTLATTEPWLHTMYNKNRDSDLSIGTSLGIDGSDAIITYMRTDSGHGLGQDIDSRCLDQMKGEYYEFSAWMRVTRKGAQPQSAVDIDTNGEWDSNLAPQLSLNNRSYRNDATKEFWKTSTIGDKAHMSRTYDPQGWNLLHGIMRMPDTYRTYFEIDRAPSNRELIVDNASFTKMACDPDNLVLNGNLETGNSKYWDTWGEKVGLKIVPGYLGGNALMSFNRGSSTNYGPAQILNLDCVSNAGNRLSFSARIKLELNGVTAQCNPFTWSNDDGPRCPDIYLHTHEGENKIRTYERVGIVSTSEYATNDGWYLASGLFSLHADQIHPLMFSKLYFPSAHQSYDVIIDDVQAKYLPKQCVALVENPSFEDGPSYWESNDKVKGKVSLYSPGASGESDFAFRSYDRDHAWRGIKQQLDPLCFVSGEEYSISAKFRMLNATDGEGVMCDVNKQQTTTDNCPSVSIYGSDCAGENVNWLFYNALGGDELAWDPDSYNDFSAAFTVNDDLATCDKVWVYIHQVNLEYEIVVDDLQISSYETESPTQAPTPGETEPVTEGGSESPTSSPTTRPTVATLTSCPVDELIPSEIPSGPVMLARSSSLCVLTKALPEFDGSLTDIAPVALSYDGGDWENAAGDFATILLYGKEFGNYAEGSHITLPDLNDNEKYYLTSYSHDVSETNKWARLLETATFGTTAQNLADWTEHALTTATAKEWIQEQMSLPVTSHREFFRQRTNARVTHSVRMGRSNHPCDALSGWRNFAFSRKEGDRAVNNVQIFEATHDGTDAYATIKLNGHVRTVVSPGLAFDNSEYTFELNKEYDMCKKPEEFVGGRFWLMMEDKSCQSLRNPLVNFYVGSVLPENVLNLPAISEGVLEPIDGPQTSDGEFILFGGLSDPLCYQLNDSTEEEDPPVFGKLPDGSWLQFDPRLVLEENTLESPIPDGGGLVRSLTGEQTRCSNVPRTFLNEEHCTLTNSATACGSAGTPNLQIDLNSDNIIDIHEMTGQYVYGILGLPLIDDFGNKQPWPCEPNIRTRWEILGANDCTQTPMGTETYATLAELLIEKGTSDENPLLRDITFPITGKTCDSSDNNALIEVEIVIESQCFRRVHPEHMSIYDFTYWTLENTHPGNMIAAMNGHPHPIKKWMDVHENTFLSYPAFAVPDAPATLANHPITRWDNYSPKFSKLGRYGDTVKFVDLPNEIRLDEVAEHFGADTELVGGGIMVCGSPFESANDPSLGHVFEVTVGRDTESIKGTQREYTWMQVGLDAPDQLRQRVAWALAQILVIARGAIEVQDSHSEIFLGYYDIFTRGAFGNYRDILREISYSPLMAENLSFLQSKSAAYTWETQDKISFADENFSREIMQLFSTGLVKLNLDGTPMLDDLGNPILAYTNDEIMSFARVWTGFDYQQGRGNVEDSKWSGNRHDPMKIQSGWRDKFPKTDMTGGYIGDGYPLCVDLPKKMFLRKGATYRLLGVSHMPELMEDDALFESDTSLRKFVLNSASDLKTKLCNADGNGVCQYANTVTLDSTLSCTDNECDADALRVVQVSVGIHYEYVRPPCVEQAFYANAKKVIFKDRQLDSSCANPLLPYASEACCEGQQDTVAERYPGYLYDQERVLYSTAGSRCDAIGMGSCDFNSIEGIDKHKKGYHWTTDGCAIQVKINAIGQVALVYEPDSYAELHRHVRNDNRNFFKVYWDGDYPKNNNDVLVGNTCGNGMCQSLVTGGCLCDTTITESRVFKKMPISVADVLSKLTVGAYTTDAYDAGTYSKPIVGDNGVTVYLAASTGVYDTNTVIEVMDDYGRLHRFKNTKEHVRVKGAKEYAFRNAPSFMSVLNTEADARDAYYETEAALDHYFYHDNVAPFIAFRIIQRFTTSNPKPRYVKAVATAFRTGIYEGIGSNEYGDLAATIAAVLLHPEARSVNLDADPFKGSLREPLLRLMALMRGMEIQQAKGTHVVKMDELDLKIGQMAHSFPSVFSFMLPEYSPGGRAGAATLVGPETMIMDMPKVVGLLNGMFSMVKYGLSRCHGGFGTEPAGCKEGDFSRATAHLSFSRPYVGTSATESSPADHAEDVVSELSTILTSGRLGIENKQIIKDAYIDELNDTAATDPSENALRLALQLILTSPEFHTTNLVAKTGALRTQPDPPQASGAPYKAIVYVMFGGGCDSFNMLVPHTCTGSKDVYTDEYLEIRQEIALQKEDLNVLNGPLRNQVCETFGVHPQLGSVQQLFNRGDLLFFANTGVLTKVTDKENYRKDTQTNLFAHNFMQRAVQRIDPLMDMDGTGVLGRIRDMLSNDGLSVGAFSIDSNSISLIGSPGVTETPMILSNLGVTQFNHDPSSSDMNDAIGSLNGETKSESGVFGELYSDVLVKSLSHNQLLYDTLEGRTTSIVFPDTHLGRQLGVVAKMIDSRAERGTDADLFYCSSGGWDTHSQLLDNQESLFADVDASFKAFADEMTAKNVWESVTLIQVSDFARTLTQNGGLGSDHAWGGNYIMMGGSVKGGQIMGTYPEGLKEGSPLNIGRGRIIPTKSWEAVFLPLAEWAGVDEADFDYICPNKKNFDANHFFDKEELFDPASTL